MRFFFFLILIYFSLYTYPQSEYLIITPLKGTGDIKLNRVAQNRILQKYGNYQIYESVEHAVYNRKVWRKTIEFDSGLEILTYKVRIFKQYKIGGISFDFPIKAKTNKGIIIGESTKEDVINIYGIPDDSYGNYLRYKKLNLVFLIESDSLKEYIINKKKINLYNKVIQIRI